MLFLVKFSVEPMAKVKFAGGNGDSDCTSRLMDETKMGVLVDKVYLKKKLYIIRFGMLKS